ncbi:MAG TPA: hypothetical protein VGD59_05480 [Acidisarcina sp.]
MNVEGIVTATVFCVLTASALAQSTTTTTPAPGTIADRKHDQQERIGNGVKSGQLTPRETTNLERREASVNHEERNMRKHDDGHLTNADRRALNQRQNHLSKSIYKDKHNARRQGPA